MQILGSDFDNTIFFPNDESLTQKNINAIKKYLEVGNVFFIITGRTYMEIEKDIKKLNIPYTYMICGDGAMIFNKSEECIEKIGLDKETVKNVIDILEKEGYEPYLEDGFAKINSYENCIKISAVYKEKEDAIRVSKKLNELLNVYTYASSAHINVNNSVNQKKQGVDRLINLANLPINNLHLIGDDINDYEMLKHYNGVVISKHNPKLDELHLQEYKTLYEYIEFLLNE